MLPVIQIGPLSLQAPGLFLLISLWVGITLAEKNAKNYKLSADQLSNLILIALVSGVVGARIGYIARFPEAFASAPRNIVSLNPGLLDITGGIAAAMGLSNFASGNAFGMETDLPWAVDLWNTKRHPSQIYEIFAALVTLNVLYPPKRIAQSPAGSAFITFVAITAGYRLFLEAFRGDSTLIFGSIRSAQVIALIVLALALWGLEKIKMQAKAE